MNARQNDSEGTFKMKVRLYGTFFKISLTSAAIWIYIIMHGKEIAQYLENYKHHEVNQGHSKKLFLQVIST